jgi:hypothetical protein
MHKDIIPACIAEKKLLEDEDDDEYENDVPGEGAELGRG